MAPPPPPATRVLSNPTALVSFELRPHVFGLESSRVDCIISNGEPGSVLPQRSPSGYHTVGGGGFHKPKIHFEKEKKGWPLCVLGKDIMMDMVQALSHRALVGHF